MLLGLLAPGRAAGQGLIELGRPPASGSQSGVLPPPSGSQSPVLPPPSGFRYAPGVEGPWGEKASGGRARARAPRSQNALPAQDIFTTIGDETTTAHAGSPLDRLDEIAPAFRRCWSPPPLPAYANGAIVTVRFSLTRDGAIFGKPVVTWQSTERIPPQLAEALRQSALAAIARCAPLRLSRGLGQAIAGRPITIRFHARTRTFEGPT